VKALSTISAAPAAKSTKPTIRLSIAELMICIKLNPSEITHDIDKPDLQVIELARLNPDALCASKGGVEEAHFLRGIKSCDAIV
jgi:hypothetical protein